MSMREYPSSGYVVPIEKVLHLFTKEDQENILMFLGENELESVEEFFDKIVEFPQFEGLYRPADEDTFDHPEGNESPSNTYVVFETEDLYELRPKKALEYLKRVGVSPVQISWSVWG